MNFLASAVSKALGPQQPNLLFSIGPLISEKHANCIWSIHAGTKKDDQQPVTVFIFNIKSNPEKLPFARNSLKRAKTIRFPDCLKFIDGCESESQIIIGTEQVEPLKSILFNDLDVNLVRLGLYKISSTIKFLAEDCKMIHGTISIHSVYVTRSGEWKLGGFETLQPIQEESFLKTHRHILPLDVPLAPELDYENNTPTSAVDFWLLGCLIFSIFNGSIKNRMELESGNRNQIPIVLFRHYKGLVASNPASRLDVARFLKFTTASKGYFDDDFIATSLFLEQLALKDKAEKENFLLNIENCVSKWPIDFCKFKILPELVQSLEFGGAGAKALKPIITIGSRLGQKEFEELVTPAIIKLFNSNDRGIRLALCEKIESYINQISEKVCNDTIYPCLATGFIDSVPVIREQTLKAVSIVAPKLQKKTINNSLLRHLAKLQIDPEPGIRTNTTICLAKLSKYFDESVKKQVLLQAFIRSLHDPFPFARKAGLMGLSATIDVFEEGDIAKKVIPNISPLLVDDDKSIRDLAFTTLDSFVKILAKRSEEAPVLKLPSEESMNEKTAGPTEVGEGWAGWAMSAVSNAAISGASIVLKNNQNASSNLHAQPTENVHQTIENAQKNSDGAIASIQSADSRVDTKNESWDLDDDGWNDTWNDNPPPSSKKISTNPPHQSIPKPLIPPKKSPLSDISLSSTIQISPPVVKPAGFSLTNNTSGFAVTNNTSGFAVTNNASGFAVTNNASGFGDFEKPSKTSLQKGAAVNDEWGGADDCGGGKKVNPIKEMGQVNSNHSSNQVYLGYYSNKSTGRSCHLVENKNYLATLVSGHKDENEYPSEALKMEDMIQLCELNACNKGLVHLSPLVLGKLETVENILLCCNLLYDIPKEIGLLRNLTHLSLSNNKLKSVPDEIGNLLSLKILLLDHNILRRIPSSIGKLSKLNNLCLNNNCLECLPSEMGKLHKLERLDISNTQISVLPSEMATLDLKSFESRNCPLVTEVSEIPIGYSPLTLKELAARMIIESKVPITNTTKAHLKDYLSLRSFCSSCGGPYFEYMVSRVRIVTRQDQRIPFEARLCKSHWNTEEQRIKNMFAPLSKAIINKNIFDDQAPQSHKRSLSASNLSKKMLRFPSLSKLKSSRSMTSVNNIH